VTNDDRDIGICPIPLYGFSGDEMEVVHSGREAAAISEFSEIVKYSSTFSTETAKAVFVQIGR
jgi:hypothetical protein